MDNLSRRIRVRSESVLEPLGLRPRHLIALTVIRERQEIAQSDLHTALRLESANVVGLLNDLESAGLVERSRSLTDRRRHNVTLTEAGNELLARAEHRLAAVEDLELQALNYDERDQLYRLLLKATVDDISR